MELFATFEKQLIEEIAVTDSEQSSSFGGTDWLSQAERMSPAVLPIMMAFKQREMELAHERDIFNKKIEMESENHCKQMEIEARTLTFRH